MEDSKGIERAGSVYIEKIQILSSKGILLDLDDYLIEINLYEDIFTPMMRGSITLSDSRNLIEYLPIICQEFLIMKISTPTFEQKIEKTFRIYGIKDRILARDKNTQVYTLNFISAEALFDVNLPIFKKFEGVVSDVVGEIFSNYVSLNRTINSANNTTDEIKSSELRVLVETSNSVKFVSPGWTPFKIINWLASKSIPKEGTACNFLFFETNKAFYYTTIEYLFDTARKNNLYLGTYSMSISNIRDNKKAGSDIEREFFIVNGLRQIEGIDNFQNYMNGYLSNRLIALDINNKKYEIVDYDHTQKYFEYEHADPAPVPFFSTTQDEEIVNPAISISYYPVQPKLFNDFKDNISEKVKDVYGNRKSNLMDLTQFKLDITISGRTDAEVGSLLYLSYPGLQPVDESTTEKQYEDKLFSGYYIITAINHKITKHEHNMICEVIKDGIASSVEKGREG